MSEHSGSSGEAMAQIASPKVIDDLSDMGVGEIVNPLKELGLSDSEYGASSGMDPMYSSGMHSYGDDQSNDTTIDSAERYVEDPYDDEDTHQHEPCQYKERNAVAAAERAERETNVRDRQELHQGPNVRWVNVRFSEHDGHLTGYRLLLKMRSAIQSQDATVTMKPQCADGPFWVSIEVVGPGGDRWARYGGFEGREAVLTAAKDIVATWLRRVREEGLPFEKDIVFRKAHGRTSTPCLRAPLDESPRSPPRRSE